MRRKKLFQRFLMFLLTIPVYLFIFLPLVWLVIPSISNRAELVAVPIHWIPQNPTFQTYIDILSPGAGGSEIARTFKASLGNSLFVGLSVTAISLIAGSL